MFATLAAAIVPICFCVLLGWLAARLGILNRERISVISIFVVTFALPAALFVGTFKFTVQELAQWQVFAALFLAMAIAWMIAFVFGRLVLRVSGPQAAVLGLNSSYPDMAYLGIPLLTALFSTAGLLPAILGNIISSFEQIPMTIALLHRHSNAGGSALLQDIKHTVTQPLVWAPILAVAMVFAGIGLPKVVDSAVGLIGQAAGGTALFALGVLLFGLSFRLNREVGTVLVVKNVLEPGLAAGLALAFGLSGVMAQAVVIIVACPCATASAMFSSSYGIAEESTAAAILVSTVTSLLTLTGWAFASSRLFGS